jgi:monoamine oxidase
MPFLPRRVAASDADVVVVGAGAAGIEAARTLIAAGRSVIVLEARDRIGGRVHFDAALGQQAAFDAGARFIHWAERNPWTDIARKLGAPATSESWGGSFATFRNGERVDPSQRAERRAAFGRVWRLLDADTPPSPDVSVAARIGDGIELEAARSLMHLSMGEEPERISVRDYARLWSGDDLEVPSGYGTLVERHGAGLPVRMSTPVRSIDWSGAGVRVETQAGVLTAGAAIVTVPVGVLQAGGIRFTPGLPAETSRALDGLGMGSLTKIALRVEGERFGLSPFSSFFDTTRADEPFSVEFWPFDRNVVLCQLGGDYARRVLGMGEREAIAFALDKLVSMLGASARGKIGPGQVAGWWTDPLARGSYSLCRPGHDDARALLAQPVADRLWFAGEATGEGPAVTVGGATLEGARAARAAIAALK